MPRGDWTLYVDESGDFSDPRDWGVVAGLLWRDHETPAARQVLCDRLRATWPLLPWPPRAAVARLSAARVAGAVLTRPCGDEPPPVRDARQAGRWLHARLQEDPPPGAEPFLQAVRAGQMPPWNALHAVESWLTRHHPGRRGLLERARVHASSALAGLLSDLAAHYGPDGIRVVAAAGRVGDQPQYESAPGKLVREPWVLLLEGVFERILALPPPGGGQRLWARVATRHVRLQGIDLGIDFRASHLGHVTGQAAAQIHRARGGPPPSLRVVPLDPVNTYDTGVHPGLVLADTLVNRLRRHTRRSQVDWGTLVRGLRGAGVLGRPEGPHLPVTALPLDSPGIDPLPTLAGGERTRVLIHRAWRQGGVVSVPALRPAWVADQARRWVRYAAGEPGDSP